jgi:GxxExxY protein
MDTDNEKELPHHELTREIIGRAFEVLNQLGHGFHEKPYENALVVELNARGITVDQQKAYPIMYRDTEVGKYIPDLIVAESLVLDTKTVNQIADQEKGQMLNYLRITDLKVGLILNFKRPKLEWERIIL